MAGELLLDTSALVSVIDRSQKYHPECLATFESWEGTIVSTEAVLTEAVHLLRDAPRGATTCIDFFLGGGATLVPTSIATLERCKALMARYADLPMDYADASLVSLAEDLDARSVFTLDADFDVYRIHGRKHFEICPDIPRKRSARGRRRSGR